MRGELVSENTVMASQVSNPDLEAKDQQVVNEIRSLHFHSKKMTDCSFYCFSTVKGILKHHYRYFYTIMQDAWKGHMVNCYSFKVLNGHKLHSKTICTSVQPATPILLSYILPNESHKKI